MCGIAGYHSKSVTYPTEKFNLAMETLSHRGPDDTGFFVSNKKIKAHAHSDSSKKIYEAHINSFDPSNTILGHKRLSIIDLSVNGHQPFQYKDTVITYNGEIYNFEEIRQELLTAGYSFQTTCDTEVFLIAYNHWGTNAFSKFNGMWAAAIFDTSTEELILTRDRFGVKPLFYHLQDDSILFASEIKFFKAAGIFLTTNKQAIYKYLRFCQIADGDDTFFNEITELPAAHFARYKDGSLSIQRYWDVNASECQPNSEIESLLIDAVGLRLRSDVKVGALLSGGLDSTTITGIVNKHYNKQKIETFSALLKDRTKDPEYEHIQALIKNTSIVNNEIDFTADISDLDELINTIEQPLRHFSEFGIYNIYKRISQGSSIKVLLTGNGADEVFAGYTDQHISYLNDLFLKLRLRKFAREYFSFRSRNSLSHVKTIKLCLTSFIQKNTIFRRIFWNKHNVFNHKFYSEYKSFVDDYFQNQMCNNLQTYPLKEYLLYDDRISMGFSLESRSPFLDFRVVQAGRSLPADELISDGWTKFPIRKIAEKLIPKSVAYRADKKGFYAPAKEWMTEDLESSLDAAFEDIRDNGLFSFLDQHQLYKCYVNFKEDNFYDTMFIWRIYCLKRWRDLWIAHE